MVQLLRKAAKFSWDDKCEEIFQQLKMFLSSPTVIEKPRPDKSIIVYLSVLEEAASVVLVQEVKKKEHPIYFISWTLHTVETRYQMIENVVFALVLIARRPYLQNHTITVRTVYPIFKNFI